jgi:predicted PolB exonuclease-like 3'-5' exonuclease
MNVFAFDIETVPDVEGGRRIYNLGPLSDEEVARAMVARRRQETGGSEFLRLHLHRIVAIAAVLRTGDRLKIWSLGEPDSPEQELVQRFFAGIDRYRPTLVSWNGSGFDLPVLHYRSLIHGVSAPMYWEVGEQESGFRWNHYLGRFHFRHTDLMDVLAGYQMRAFAPLDEMATLVGLPGKMGMNGAQVWESYRAGEIVRIRNYCETDALNTYLLYLRFELCRGRLGREEYEAACAQVRQDLSAEQRPHLQEFLRVWESRASA